MLKQSVLIEKFIFFIKCVLFGVRGAFVPAAKLICFVCSVSDYVRFFVRMPGGDAMAGCDFVSLFRRFGRFWRIVPDGLAGLERFCMNFDIFYVNC